MDAQSNKPVIVALTEDHVSAITGLSKGQLRAWDKRGFFVPKFAYDDRRSAYSRIYSFKDVVGLKAIAELRQKHHISIKKLEAVARMMEQRGFEHWADIKLYVVKGEVHFREPASDEVESIADGQLAMLPIIEIISDVTAQVEKLKHRASDQFGRIKRSKHVARNSWVVAGTRIPTATIRRYLEAGFSKDYIISEYPSLTGDDIDAVIEHEKSLAKTA
jgi:uncharacterized protein (DUF433 family)